jgi:hypothetical protein
MLAFLYYTNIFLINQIQLWQNKSKIPVDLGYRPIYNKYCCERGGLDAMSRSLS